MYGCCTFMANKAKRDLKLKLERDSKGQLPDHLQITHLDNIGGENNGRAVFLFSPIFRKMARCHVMMYRRSQSKMTLLTGTISRFNSLEEAVRLKH